MLNSCTTGPQTGSLIGTVNLEGESDHSGIMIGIYEQVILDTTITRINNKYPHIGIKISQHTEFDHRFGTLVKTGETDASGYFEIGNISAGVYNVVAIKDSFGFRYIYNVQINEGDNTLPTKKAILTLYSETLINSNISSPTTWKNEHHYIIEQDIIIDDALTIEPGAVVRLNQGKDITSYGTFTAVGEHENFIWFTKNDGFSEDLHTLEPDSNYIWDRVTLEPYSQAQVQWCKFDWANIGLFNHINGFEVSDCIFRDSQCGFKAEDVDSCFCSNLLCEEIDNAEEAGIYFNQVSNGMIEKNIVNDCENGIKIKDYTNPTIKNNFISNCNYGKDVSFYCAPLIKLNEIENCDIGIASYRSNNEYEIKNNNINCSIGFKSWFHIYEPVNIHYNNFNCMNYSIYSGSGSVQVYAEQNYFYTIDETEIQDLIYDKNDVEPSQQQNYGEVFYDPFLTEEYPYAGIQEE